MLESKCCFLFDQIWLGQTCSNETLNDLIWKNSEYQVWSSQQDLQLLHSLFFHLRKFYQTLVINLNTKFESHIDFLKLCHALVKFETYIKHASLYHAGTTVNFFLTYDPWLWSCRNHGVSSSVLVDLTYVIISASISPSDGIVFGQGRAPILQGREHGLPRP